MPKYNKGWNLNSALQHLTIFDIGLRLKVVSLNQSFSQPNWTYQGDRQSNQHQPIGHHQHQLVAFKAVGGLNVGWGDCREFNQNLNLWETKQIEKTHAKKNNYMHKTIFT